MSRPTDPIVIITPRKNADGETLLIPATFRSQEDAIDYINSLSEDVE